MTGARADWWARGACLDEPSELFFPIGTTGSAALQITRAKQICAQCTVRDECLQWAMSLNVEHGVWGGLSEDERRSLRRRGARDRLAARVSLAVLPNLTLECPDE
ncbi:MAG TPA: WhiB family transcriptional regulator [Propionibacteriaceae bacterium]